MNRPSSETISLTRRERAQKASVTAYDGSPLVQGVRVTGVTNRQIQQLGISVTPKHPETELRNAGALFECSHALIEMTANHVVVDPAHKIVSAQNQKGGVEAAVKALEALMADKKAGSVRMSPVEAA